MAQSIVWTHSAHQDRIAILSYWIEKTNSKEYSRKLNQIFIHHTESLLKFPLLGKQTELENIRCLPISDYSIFYQVESKIIIIHRIWDNRQNPEKFDI